jgi:hypothetical protein
MTNWNGITPAPGGITPTNGMLVEYKNAWYVVDRWTGGDSYNYAANADNTMFWKYCTLHSVDNKTPMALDDCTYLAPAPTPGGLWAALEGIADSAMERKGCLVIPHCKVARTEISTNGGFKDFVILYTRLTDKMLPLLDTARQHHGALLAYCAQPGWEATR